FEDRSLLSLGHQLHRAQKLPMGALGHALPAPEQVPGAEDPPGAVSVAVLGAHMSGLPLNHELTNLGGRFVRKDRTAARYRLFALPNVSPAKPGLVRVAPGHGIDLEIWRLPVGSFGTFVAGIPAPLAIGKIELASGDHIAGFLCESYAIEGAKDISELGGWRRYLEAARAG
ncbi:MAG: allophanate hydrolase-related protein, partial [Stellaceae bacterium]